MEIPIAGISRQELHRNCFDRDDTGVCDYVYQSQIFYFRMEEYDASGAEYGYAGCHGFWCELFVFGCDDLRDDLCDGNGEPYACDEIS